MYQLFIQVVNSLLSQLKTQSGGFLGTLLASIGVPLLLNALTGKGLQVDKQSSRRSVNVHVPKANKGGLIMPQKWRSPPFYGNWPQTSGMGLKKKNLERQKKAKACF